MQNLTRKLKLLEADLEQSEDKATDSEKKFRVAEAQVEELQREKKQMENQIGMLESECAWGRGWGLMHVHGRVCVHGRGRGSVHVLFEKLG